jgi:hypothetical protein
MPELSLRLERAETTRLAWAFALSVILHLLVFGSYEAGKEFGLWQRLQLPAWMKTSRMLTQVLDKKNAPPPQVQEEVALMFVDVSPAQASPEPPKQAKFYSNKNALAANPEPDKLTAIPKIEGKRPELMKTEDTPREKFTPLQPTPPVPQAKEPQEEIKATTTYKPGDLTMAKPEPNPTKDDGQEKRSKPKTVQEARARLQENRLAGEKMRQEGGVDRRREVASLDTKATAFGDYDYFLVLAIQNCWYGLLDEQRYASDFRGKVVLQFRLHYDGSISDLNVVENTAGSIPGLLCETAVDKPKPFGKFSADMRRVVGDIRNIQFTFFYN